MQRHHAQHGDRSAPAIVRAPSQRVYRRRVVNRKRLRCHPVSPQARAACRCREAWRAFRAWKRSASTLKVAAVRRSERRPTAAPMPVKASAQAMAWGPERSPDRSSTRIRNSDTSSNASARNRGAGAAHRPHQPRVEPPHRNDGRPEQRERAGEDQRRFGADGRVAGQVVVVAKADRQADHRIRRYRTERVARADRRRPPSAPAQRRPGTGSARRRARLSLSRWRSRARRWSSASPK